MSNTLTGNWRVEIGVSTVIGGLLPSASLADLPPTGGKEKRG